MYFYIVFIRFIHGYSLFYAEQRGQLRRPASAGNMDRPPPWIDPGVGVPQTGPGGPKRA